MTTEQQTIEGHGCVSAEREIDALSELVEWWTDKHRTQTREQDAKIAALEAERDRLREALEYIEGPNALSMTTQIIADMRRVARAALEGTAT